MKRNLIYYFWAWFNDEEGNMPIFSLPDQKASLLFKLENGKQRPILTDNKAALWRLHLKGPGKNWAKWICTKSSDLQMNLRFFPKKTNLLSWCTTEHRIKRDLGATFHLVSKWRHKEGKNRGKFPKHNYFYCYFYLQQPLATAWGSEYMLLLAWVTSMMRMMMMMTAKFCLIVEYLMLHCTDGDDCKLCLYPKTSNMVKMMILRIWYLYIMTTYVYLSVCCLFVRTCLCLW